MTITRTNNPTNFSKIIDKKNSTLNTIIQRASNLQNLTKLFRTALSTELAEHCFITELSETKMNLIVDNSSWATILHYQIPELIKTLRTQAEFKNLKIIKYKVKKVT